MEEHKLSQNEIIVAYNNKARNNTLHPKVSYTLYIKLNGDNNGHFIYDLSRDELVITTNYQSVPVPIDLFESTNRIKSSNSKIQVDHFDVEHPIVWREDSNNTKYKSQSSNSNKDDSEDGDTYELGNSQHLYDLMSDKIVDHED